MRRNIEDPTEYAYYLCYGPAQRPVKELIRVAGRRWAIEDSFKAAKGEVGLEEYEVLEVGWLQATHNPLLIGPRLFGRSALNGRA
jgi:SRSO17 transposase